MILGRVLAVLLFLTAPAVLADAPGVYAIRGGTVHPVSGAAIERGIVVIRGGLIEAVGANAAIPPDATTIDASGAHVYPGLIDAQTFLGFAAGKDDKPAVPSADSLAIRNAKIADADLDAGRAIGVTTVVTAPTADIFNGQSVMLNLGSGPMESRVVKNPAALQISFNTRPDWTYPDSLMGVFAYIRQSFLDARQYTTAHEIYERAPAGLRRPPENPALSALGLATRRELPVVFIADSEAMIRRALALANELEVKPILSGARQAYALGAELKNVPVLVSVKWAEAPADKEDRADQPLRIIRERQLAPTTPSVLAKNGVTFALVSNPGKAGDFIPGIRKAIENGLSEDEALRATTINPARIFGVDRQLGSLERGKIANVVITDKPIFAKDAKVTRLFIDGRELRLPPADEKKDAPTPASAVDGTWALSVRAPQGNVSITVTLRAESGRISGTFSGDRGSGDIRGGSFDGTNVSFTIAAQSEGEEASDWVFRGTLSGTSMTGTVATNLGSFDFSGSKSE